MKHEKWLIRLDDEWITSTLTAVRIYDLKRKRTDTSNDDTQRVHQQKKGGKGVPVVLIVIHGCCAWVIIIISLSIQGKESGRMLLLRLHKAELIWLNLSVYFFFFFIIIIIVIFFFFFSIYICSHCSSLQTLLCFSFIFVGNWSLLSITGDYTSQFSSLTTFKYNTGGGGGPKRKRRKENKNPDEQSRKSACAGRDPCWSRNKHRNPILFFFLSRLLSLSHIEQVSRSIFLNVASVLGLFLLHIISSMTDGFKCLPKNWVGAI